MEAEELKREEQRWTNYNQPLYFISKTEIDSLRADISWLRSVERQKHACGILDRVLNRNVHV